MKKALVVIPVFNEEKHLKEVLSDIPRECLGVDIDTLVVNDGSSDKSRKIANQSGVLLLNHRENFGYGVSVTDGLDYAIKNGYDYVVKIDADGQHDPSYVSTILKILGRGGVDYVLSSRYLRRVDAVSKPPVDRKLVNMMITGAINKITGRRLSDAFCGFFGFRIEELKKIMPFKTKGYGIELEMILKAHFRGLELLEIPHPLIYTKGSSKFLEVYRTDHNLGLRLENYASIVMDTLEEINVSLV